MDKVQILLSSYNGEKYLREQIESLIRQKNVYVDILIRDDGSDDATLDIICEYEKRYPFVHLIKGDNIGAKGSFLELISLSDGADYYAFCDQDDVWDEDKLAAAVSEIKNRELPSMYFSSTRVVDQNLSLKDRAGLSEDDMRIFSLNDVLIRNNATGCTIVFNSELQAVLKQYKPHTLIMHDHWVYAVCIAIGGFVYLDKDPHISYRQHENNSLGSKMSIKKRIQYSSIKRGKNVRSQIAAQIIENYRDKISSDNIRILNSAAYYRKSFKARVNAYNCLKCVSENYKRRMILMAEILLGIY